MAPSLPLPPRYTLTRPRIAGSDTTAMALRAIFYFVVKNPKSYAKLAEEIDAAKKAGRFSEVVEYQQALELPYLQAVIKEAMRLHPGVGVPLERVVPDGGAELCSQYLPAGTEVGINAWVVHRDEGVWGRDAHEFRPERWIDAEPEQLKKMEHCFFSFGGGARTCIGMLPSILAH
jgi:cytochrome P450